MNEPTPMLEQARLIREIAESAISAVERTDATLRLSYFATWPRSSTVFDVLRPGQAPERLRTPRSSRQPSAQLRTVMYRPGVGTWFEMELTIDVAGRVTTRFNYDEEPDQHIPFTAGEYLRDQEQFPRDVEHQPEWLRAKLAEASEAAASASNARMVGDTLVLETTKAWGVLRDEAIASGHRDHPELAPLFEDDVLGTDDDFRRWYGAWFPIVYPGITVTEYEVIPRSVSRITLAGDPDTLQRIAKQPW